MKTSEQIKAEELVTKLFHMHLQRHNGTTSATNYEFLNGELWYCGNPIENSMTRNERDCLEFALGESLNILCTIQ
jgi:hypothetical protein